MRVHIKQHCSAATSLEREWTNQVSSVTLGLRVSIQWALDEPECVYTVHANDCTQVNHWQTVVAFAGIGQPHSFKDFVQAWCVHQLVAYFTERTPTASGLFSRDPASEQYGISSYGIQPPSSLFIIGRTDREQIRSRINNNWCRTFWSRRPLSTAYKTVFNSCYWFCYVTAHDQFARYRQRSNEPLRHLRYSQWGVLFLMQKEKLNDWVSSCSSFNHRIQTQAGGKNFGETPIDATVL